jgi:putative Mg2+ transporter-C (MgtC) family protein
MNWHAFQFEPQYMLMIAARLLAACVLGGIIGFEREMSNHKPAGFRTHILVSLGSCLVMLISQFAMSAFQGTANIDPTRLGAQVVSGIGFLGAGAIIRHGVSVKGITTAASIWAVACLGLACGAGFYAAAVLATLLVWLVLMYLKVFEMKFQTKEHLMNITVEVQYSSLEDLSVENELKLLGLDVRSMDVTKTDNTILQRLTCKQQKSAAPEGMEDIVRKIMHIKGVVRVTL